MAGKAFRTTATVAKKAAARQLPETPGAHRTGFMNW